MRKVFFAISFSLIACSTDKINSQDHNVSVLTIDPNKENYNTSNFVKNVRAIQLKDSPILFNQNTRRLIVTPGIFWLWSQDENTVVSFTTGGEVFKSFNHEGSGPGEYVSIHYATYLNTDSLFVIHNQTTRKSLFYNLKGEFVKQVQFPFAAKEFTAIDSSHTAFYFASREEINGLNHDFCIVSNKGDILLKDLKFNDNKNFRNFNFYHTENDLLFVKEFCDTIYSIKVDEVKPHYYINFDNKNLPKEKRIRNSVDFMDLKESDFAHLIYDISESDNFLSFKFLFRGNVKLALLNKKTNEYYSGNPTDDLFIGFNVKNFYLFEDKGYCLVSSEALSTVWTNSKLSSERQLRLKKVFPDLEKLSEKFNEQFDVILELTLK